MALSYVLYTNQTTTGPYNITFPYISTAHIKVEKNNSPLTITTDYTLSTSPTPSITLTAALTAGDVLRIYRQTPGRSASPNNLPLVDFTDGSVLTAADLDKNTQQLLYLVQESDDTGSGALGPTTDGANWSAASKQIKNLSTPTDTTDATTKQYVDNLALYGVNQASGQAWDLVGNGTNSYLLTGPVPSAAAPELFIVEVGGALQHPGTNYTIVQSAGNIYLQFSSIVSSPTTIRVRNFGVSRGTISGSTITVDDSTLAVDMANNRVGIGTATPQSNLNVHGSTAVSRIQLTNTTTGNASSSAGMSMETNGTSGYLWNYASGPIIFGTANTDWGRIESGGKMIIGSNLGATGYKFDVNGTACIGANTDVSPDTSGNGHLRIRGAGYQGYIALDAAAMHIGHNVNTRAITFDINETEAVRITTAGNVAIGRTDADVPLMLKNNVATDTTTVDNVANQIKLYDAVNAVYGFGTSSGSLNISANQSTTGAIRFWTGGTDSVAPVNRLTIPASSGGIQFPATAALSSDANTLDDYREGTHTIASADFVGNGTAGSYNLSAGSVINYTRIGNRVLFDAQLNIGGVNTAGSGTALIINVPFSSQSTGGGWFPCYFQGLATSAITVYAYWSGSNIYFYQATAAAAALATLPVTSFVSATNIRFSGTIRV